MIIGREGLRIIPVFERTVIVMQPTLKQLEALYWTGKLGSFQAAATHLHASQSAIAKRIGELQDIFRIPLVDPAYRRAKLTDHGQRLMLLAEEVLLATRKMMQSMSHPSDFNGILRLGVSELVAITWLPLLIERLKIQYPQAVVELDAAPGGLILDKLKAGEIDLALVAGPMWDQQFESVELEEVEFHWMASPRLGVPSWVMTPEELSIYPMLVHSPHGVVSQIFEQWQRRSGFSIQRVFAANSLMVMVQMTINGLGISSLPAKYVEDHVAAGRLVRLRTNPQLPKLKYFAVYRAMDEYPFIEKVIPLAKSVCDFGLNSSMTLSRFQVR